MKLDTLTQQVHALVRGALTQDALRALEDESRGELDRFESAAYELLQALAKRDGTAGWACAMICAATTYRQCLLACEEATAGLASGSRVVSLAKRRDSVT